MHTHPKHLTALTDKRVKDEKERPASAPLHGGARRRKKGQHGQKKLGVVVVVRSHLSLSLPPSRKRGGRERKGGRCEKHSHQKKKVPHCAGHRWILCRVMNRNVVGPTTKESKCGRARRRARAAAAAAAEGAPSPPRPAAGAGFAEPDGKSADYLVDPASSHMLLSRTKAMQVSEQIRGSSPVPSADGSLHQQSSTRRSGRGPTGPHSPLGYQA